MTADPLAQLDDLGERHARHRVAAAALTVHAHTVIADALRANIGPAEIHRRTGYSRQTINTIREDAGIPTARPIRTPEAS